MDLPKSVACVPGVQEVTPDGEDRYQAILKVRMGPISLNFSGTILVREKDRDGKRASFQVDATDRRVGGGMKTDMTIEMAAQSDNSTELLIITDTTFMGKLGELGQPIIRRKARTTLEEFARNLARLAESP